MMAAHQKQAGGETKAPAARAGTLGVIGSRRAAERRANDVMFNAAQVLDGGLRHGLPELLGLYLTRRCRYSRLVLLQLLNVSQHIRGTI